MVSQGVTRHGPVGYDVAVTATLKSCDLRTTTQQERNKMKEKIKTLWTEALRSGEYEQGQEQLKTNAAEGHKDKFCCLGVLTDLYCKDKGVSWEEATELARNPDEWNKTQAISYMPECVASWAGFLETELSDQGDDGIDVHLLKLEHEDRNYKYNSCNAANINDSYMRNPAASHGSFDDIADLVERNL